MSAGVPFEDAWDELVTIRAAMEQGRVRVGAVAVTLARAAELTAICRGHLRAAEIAVEELAMTPPEQNGAPAGERQFAGVDGRRPGQ